LRLSIIIPLYNVQGFVGQCIQSILGQNLSPNDYEIVVIDDGSTDNSVSVVKAFQEENHNIFIYHQENSGVGSARNKGLSLAKGQYVYFIDPDDYLANNVLNPILEYAEKYHLQVSTFSSKITTNRKLDICNFNHIESQPVKILSGMDYIGEMRYKNEVWWYITERTFLQDIELEFIMGRWMEDAIFTTNLLLKANRVAYLHIDAHRYVTVENSAMTSKEPQHYINVIYDNSNAAKVFNGLIQVAKHSKPFNGASVNRLKERQQSFVFFMMIRILKSKITFREVKEIMESMVKINVYPLNTFSKKDYTAIEYKILVRLFNIRHLYYALFLILNPFLKRINR
tara:strand:+ start:5054 stop:6076 length:1023 start_codon:yes stop_codon:yes gene_type:complete